MRPRTAWALALGVGAPVSALAVASTLLRIQSGRLRRSFLADSGRRVPELAVVVDAMRSTAEHLALDDTSAEDLPAVAVLGDSWLAGLGLDRRRRTPGALIARGMSRMLERPVRLRTAAQPSVRAEDFGAQVTAVLADRRLRRSRTRAGAREPRYAIIAMGTADVVHPLSGSISIAVLSSAINRLQREGGYRVIVLVCPNLGGLPGIPRPLRDVLRRTSRVLAGSQWLTALSTGALPVSLNQTLSGTSDVGLISVAGRFPSPLGYAQLAAAVVRRIAGDLDLPSSVVGPDAETDTEPATDPTPRPHPEEPQP